MGGVCDLPADLVCGVVPASSALALEFAQPVPRLRLEPLPGHPALVPLDLGVLDGCVGEGMDFARAVRGLPHVAVDSDRTLSRGLAHIGVVARHLEHDVGVPLRLPATPAVRGRSAAGRRHTGGGSDVRGHSIRTHGEGRLGVACLVYARCPSKNGIARQYRTIS